MGVVRKMVVKKAKEKISSKAAFLEPVEKLANEFHLKRTVDKALGKKEVTSESFGDKRELKEEVKESAEKVPQKSFKESFVKRVIKTSLGLLGFGIGKEILSKKGTEAVSQTTAELLTDDKKLKIANDKLEKELNDESSLIHKFHYEKDPAKKEELEKKIEKYRDKNFKFWDMVKDTWSETAENNEGEKRGFFSHLWHSVGKLFKNYFFYKGVKKAEKAGLLKLSEEAGIIKKKGEKAVESVQEKIRQVKQVKKAGTKVRVLRKASDIPAKDLVKTFEDETSSLYKSLAERKISNKTLAKGLEEANIKLFKRASENGQVKELLKLMKKGKISGLELPAKFSAESQGVMRRLTKLKINPFSMAIGVALTEVGMNAHNKGGFSSFGKSLISKETLTEAFIPGVGTWRSIKRNWHNSQTPTWLKVTDIGLNVLGDAWLTAGYVSSFFSFGGGAVAGVAGRTALLGLGKRLLTREGVEIAAKAAGKKIVAKETRQAALKAVGKTVKDGAKIAVIGSAATFALQVAMKKFFNKDKVNEAFNEMLSKEQRRSLELAKRAKTEYKMSA